MPTSAAAPFDHLLIPHASAASEAGAAALKVVKLPNLAALLARLQPLADATPEADARERRRQEAISAVKRKFGKNSLLKGVDLLPEATTRERNLQIGGHRSGE